LITRVGFIALNAASPDGSPVSQAFGCGSLVKGKPWLSGDLRQAAVVNVVRTESGQTRMAGAPGFPAARRIGWLTIWQYSINSAFRCPIKTG
jgi:hypothetical protein